jgi:hypothetical protein
MVAAKDGGRDLPWGWWLRANGNVLEDVDGREWRSVRDAFWQGRLGFPVHHEARDQQELLLRTLTRIDAHWCYGSELPHDLFGGDMFFCRFYICWLTSIGLVENADRSVPEAPLSDEGRSVMLMLQATRQPEWIDLPMAGIVDAVRSAGRSGADQARELALGAFERSVTRLPRVFARERLGRLHLVTLTGVDLEARIPMRRVVWSMSFADARVRDDFFGWLAERVDRWESWNELASRSGVLVLTQHFLATLVATSALSDPQKGDRHD